MSDRELLLVDPATLHLPGERRAGADPMKLHRQWIRHGRSVAGMPPEVGRGNDGVTRATRVAKSLPGTSVTVEVTGALPVAVGGWPAVGERLWRAMELARNC